MASAEQPGNPSPEDPTASAPPEAGAEAASTSPERQFMQDITGVGQPNMTNSQREYLRSLRGMQDIPLVKQRIRTRKDRSSTARPTPRLGGASSSPRRGPDLTTRLRRTMRRWFRPSGDAPGSSRGIVGGLLALSRGTLGRSSRSDRLAPRREANRKNIQRTLIVVPVVVAALYGLHQWQTRRVAPMLLARSESLQVDGQLAASANLLRQYVQLQPQDAAARIRLAETLAQLADTSQDGGTALRLRQEAVLMQPDSPAQHRALAEAALRLQRYDLAEQEADAILQIVPRDFTATRLRALAAYGRLVTGRNIALEDAVKALERAVEQTPGDAELVITLAALYRERFHVPSKSVSAATADGLVEQMVSKAETKAASYLARAWYRESYALEGVAEDLAKALELAPNDVEMHLAMADYARRHQQHPLAEQHYRRATQLSPHDLRSYLGLGQLLMDKSEMAQAEEVWKKGLEIHREHPQPAVALILRLRQAEADIVSGRIDDPKKALDAVKRDVQGLSLRLTPVQQSQFETALDVLLARYWLVQRKFDLALPLLKQAMTAAAANRSGTAWTEVQLRYHMAACYEGLGQFDRSAELYEDATRLEPAQPRHYERAGRAWGRTGRWSRAVELLDQAVAMPSCPPEVWVTMAHAQLQYQLSLPVVERDMSGLERALVAANDRGLAVDALPLLTADAQTLAGNPDNALSALATAQRQRPNSPVLLRAYVLMLDHLNRREEADQALASFETHNGVSLETELLRADLQQARGNMEQAQAVLTGALDQSLDPGRQTVLKHEHAELALQTGRWDEARQALTELAIDHPEQLPIVEQLARLELSLGELSNLERWEQRLRELEGDDGASWRYFRARRMLAEAAGPSDPRLDEVRRLQQSLETLRPGWPQAYVLAGRLADLEGQSIRARKAYQTAIEFGDTDLESYERLVALAYEQQDLLEASQFLTLLGEAVNNSASLSSLAMSAAVQQGQFERMLELAADAARRQPDDALPQVWMGQALTLAGRRTEAEQALLAAREMARDDSRPALALVEFYVRGGDIPQARQALEQLAADPNIETSDKAFALAQGCELTLDDKSAEQYYRQAMERSPEQETFLVRAAAFFHDRDPTTAARALAQALSISRAEGETRRNLALALVRRGGAKNLAAAQELFRERVDVEASDRRQDVRLAAYLSLRYGDAAERAAAIARMEQLLEQDKTEAPDDHVLVARLLEADEQLVAAAEHLARAAAPLNPLPDHVAAFADALLRLQQIAEVRPPLEKLAALEPDSMRSLRLRGRYMELAAETEQIPAMLTSSLGKQYEKLAGPLQKSAFCWRAAALCDTLAQDALANQWYERALELDPAGFPAYVRHLLRRGKGDVAIRLTAERLKQAPTSDTARLLCEALVRNRAEQETVRTFLPQIRQVVVKHSQDPNLLTAAGDLYWLAVGAVDEAEKLYRRAIRIRPNHLPALNNLAAMLSENAVQAAAAQEWIDQALNFGGPLPWLEDTRAMVALRQGDVRLAVRILRELASGRHSSPLTLFHLAYAYQQDGDQALARLSLRQAVERNLDAELLTPAERKLRQELESALAE